MQQEQLQQNQQNQMQQAQAQQQVQQKQPHPQQQQQQQQQQSSQQKPGALQDKNEQKEQNNINVPKGKHRFESNGTVFVVDEKYQHIKEIGNGKYDACSAMNKQTGQKVFIKKLSYVYQELDYAKRIIREIKLLKSFDHENVIQLLDVIKSNGPTGNEDIYMVFEFMETDLHRVIHSKQELSDEHIQYLIYQILRGLLYIHSANVIHTELKPENIFLNKNCDLKICNFRLARGFEEEYGFSYNLCYVPARWHIAPELVLREDECNQAVDIWSVGCIAAYLLGRMPLFPAENWENQVQMIIAVLGTPTQEDMTFFRNEVFQYIQSQPKRTKKEWQTLYPNANPQLLDLLNKMLVFNPDKRYTVKQCLEHPYFEGLHFAEEEEPEANKPFDWASDNFEPTKEILQKMIDTECLSFHNSG